MSLLRTLQVAQSKYNATVGKIEQRLKDKIDFDFSVQWQPSDGWTIVSESSDVAPFEYCMKVIESKGVLSEAEFKKGCI